MACDSKHKMLKYFSGYYTCCHMWKYCCSYTIVTTHILTNYILLLITMITAATLAISIPGLLVYCSYYCYHYYYYYCCY